MKKNNKTRNQFIAFGSIFILLLAAIFIINQLSIRVNAAKLHFTLWGCFQLLALV